MSGGQRHVPAAPALPAAGLIIMGLQMAGVFAVTRHQLLSFSSRACLMVSQQQG